MGIRSIAMLDSLDAELPSNSLTSEQGWEAIYKVNTSYYTANTPCKIGHNPENLPAIRNRWRMAMSFQITVVRLWQNIPLTVDHVRQNAKGIIAYQSSPPLNVPFLVPVDDPENIPQILVTIEGDAWPTHATNVGLWGAVRNGQIGGSAVWPGGGNAGGLIIVVDKFAPNESSKQSINDGYQLLGPINWSLTIGDDDPHQLGSLPLQMFVGSPDTPQYLEYETLFQYVARDMIVPWIDQGVTAACAQAIWPVPPSYDNPMNYLVYPKGDFKLQQWILGVYGYTQCPTADCYDISTMCNLLLLLNQATNPCQVWSGWITPWGWNNNYTIRGGGKSKYGSGLSEHAVSVIRYPDASGPEGLVCDATYGPYSGSGAYVGNITPEDYLAQMTMGSSTPLPPSKWAVPPGTPGSSNNYSLPLTVDGQNIQQGQTVASVEFLERRQSFATRAPVKPVGVTAPRGDLPNLAECPELSEYSPIAEYSFYDHPASRQYSILSNGASTVYVELWVSSDGDAWDLFLNEGASAEFDAPFEPLAGADGPWMTRRSAGWVEHLWIAAHVVARVRCFGDGIPDQVIAEWFRSAVLDGAATNAGAGPQIEDVILTSPSVAVGSSVEVSVRSASILPLRILHAAPFLEVGEPGPLTRKLIGRVPGEARLRVILADPHTLLTDCREASVSVIQDG